jgi:cytochrome d ubiquinol oxidase subunit II
VLVSSTSFADSLTVANASSEHYTLVVMTVVAAVCLPLILVYQGWTYHVFRARVGGDELEPAETPEPLPEPGGAPAT